MKGVLDTSVFIAAEQDRPPRLEALPEEAAVSVLTVAELELGVHLAEDDEIRARRLATLSAQRATYVALPIDEAVAASFATLVAIAPETGPAPEGPRHVGRGDRANARGGGLHAGRRLRRPGRRRRPRVISA